MHPEIPVLFGLVQAQMLRTMDDMDTAQRGQTLVPTEQATQSAWTALAVHSLLALTPELPRYQLSAFGRQLRITIGRQSDVDIQLIGQRVSRQHCVLHTFNGRLEVTQHLSASQPTRLNGLVLGKRSFDLGPWQFVEIGEVMLCALGAEPPGVSVALPAKDPLETAIQALVVYGNLSAAARLSGVKRNTLRRRLQATETGRAMLDRVGQAWRFGWRRHFLFFDEE